VAARIKFSRGKKDQPADFVGYLIFQREGCLGMGSLQAAPFCFPELCYSDA